MKSDKCDELTLYEINPKLEAFVQIRTEWIFDTRRAKITLKKRRFGGKKKAGEKM